MPALSRSNTLTSGPLLFQGGLYRSSKCVKTWQVLCNMGKCELIHFGSKKNRKLAYYISVASLESADVIM